MKYYDKVYLLETNLKRATNQHQKIRELLYNSQVKYKAQNLNEHVNEAQRKMFQLTNLKNFLTSNNSSYSQLNAQDTQKMIALLKQSLKNVEQMRNKIVKMKVDLNLSIRNKPKIMKTQIQKALQICEQQIQILSRHSSKYLQNIKQELIKSQLNKSLEESVQILSSSIDDYFSEIQTQIGILICEIQYFSLNQYQNQINSKQKRLKPQQDGTQIYDSILQSGKRITHNFNLLLKKLQISTECATANTKMRFKKKQTNFDYRKQSYQLRNRFKKNSGQLNFLKFQNQFKTMIEKLNKKYKKKNHQQVEESLKRMQELQKLVQSKLLRFGKMIKIGGNIVV